MLTYMLDTNICIYVMKNYPPNLLEKFNTLADQLCISSITLGELHYGAEKSARRADNLTAIDIGCGFNVRCWGEKTDDPSLHAQASF
jgi:tRNA(fMet)-specific endonuclease VapC